MFFRCFLLFFLFVSAFAEAANYTVNEDLIGETTYYTVQEEDNLYEIARKNDIGIVELLAANPNKDPWIPEEDSELTLPTAHLLPSIREGIVINLPELRLFYFSDNGEIFSFPIGIGMAGWQTPTGTTKIVRKRENPVWIPPDSIRKENPDLPKIIPAGEDNPLGQYALYLEWKSYLIHGTNRPYGIGKRSSHGCIRLYPEDIAKLFELVKIGTKVTVVDEPYKLGWHGDSLLLEVTPTQTQADDIANYKVPSPLSLPKIYDAVKKVAGENTQIDWYEVENAVATRNGIPVVIANRR